MKFENAYILSWFGTKADNELREKRKKYHARQVTWFRNHSLNCVVLAQEYNQGEEDPSVGRYIVRDTPVFPGPGRNILLKEFYNSDQDFAVFADNDSVLYDGPQHMDGATFIQEMQKRPVEDFKYIDMIVPINPQKVPFNEEFRTNEELYRTNYVFKRCVGTKGSLFILRNLKKHYGKEVYFDEGCEYVDGGVKKILPIEDVDFGLQLLSQNMTVFQTYNILLNEYASTNSTWWDNKVPRRRDQNVIGREYIAKKYDLPISADGDQVDFDPIHKRVKTPSKMYVSKGKSTAMDEFF